MWHDALRRDSRRGAARHNGDRLENLSYAKVKMPTKVKAAASTRIWIARSARGSPSGRHFLLYG